MVDYYHGNLFAHNFLNNTLHVQSSRKIQIAPLGGDQSTKQQVFTTTSPHSAECINSSQKCVLTGLFPVFKEESGERGFPKK